MFPRDEYPEQGKPLFATEPLETRSPSHLMQRQISTFQARAPWWGGDLQTLRNVVMRQPEALPGRASPLEFEMHDGSGDKLLGALNVPDEPGRSSTLVVLIHGLTGCEESDYMLASARFHLARGRSVLRLNLRGAGPGKSLASRYYHAGCAGDIQAVLDGLAPKLTVSGLFLIGYSLGGNILLNWLGRGETHFPVLGAATVSAPIEPAQACARMMTARNWLYHRFLLKRMQRDVLASSGGISAGLSGAERQAIVGAKTILDFDDRWVAPRNGFDGAADYYTRTAGAQFVPAIQVPTLMIHAQDDPWIPPEPYFRLHEGRYPNVELVLPSSGGHLGFHEQGQAETWHDRAIDAFLARLTR